MAEAVTAETRLRSRASLCDRIGLGQVLLSPVLLFSPVSIIPIMLHTVHLNSALVRQTSRQNLENLK